MEELDLLTLLLQSKYEDLANAHVSVSMHVLLLQC